jgi:hypothetical protein
MQSWATWELSTGKFLSNRPGGIQEAHFVPLIISSIHVKLGPIAPILVTICIVSFSDIQLRENSGLVCWLENTDRENVT